MKMIYHFGLAFILLLASCKKTATVSDTQLGQGNPMANPTPSGGLLWSDEFDYTGLPNPLKWGYDVGGNGWGNRELQFYTDKVTKNARVEDGKLIIEAHLESTGTAGYTSARLVSRDRANWAYGKIEVRAKLPQGRGTWPAIWMLADKPNMRWPDDGEIDIMEHVGFDPGVVHGTVHTGAYNHSKGTQKGGKIIEPKVMDSFHTYSIVWSGDKIDFFLDDKKYFTFNNERRSAAEWPFDRPFYLLLNIAVGGAWGGQKGVDNSVFPQRMEIDYVRVYKL
jgi:beta-glucanase (GH16 family)